MLKNLAFVTVVLVGIVSAQSPKDLDGWREAKWGMTREQVVQVFKGEAKQSPPIKTKRGFVDGAVSIERLMVDDKESRVRFEFTVETGKLQRVLVEPTGASNIFFSDWYRGMIPLLIEKYGPPTVRSEPRLVQGAVNESMTWSFPSSTIELVTHGQMLTTRIEFRQGGTKNNPL